MEAGATAPNNNSSSTGTMMSVWPMSSPTARRVVYWGLGVRSVADALPGVLGAVVNSGKLSILVYFASNVIIMILWVPLWLLSFVVSEWGVYGCLVALVFMIGRAIIRMIALPGASSRVSSEIEKEFSKYSVKMIMNSCITLSDFASSIKSCGSEVPASRVAEFNSYWKKTKSHRDKVLGVYTDVLSYILLDGQQSTHLQSPQLTKYGNNRISGDVGDLTRVTPEARMDGRHLLEKLTKALAEVDQMESLLMPALNVTPGQSFPIDASLKASAGSLLAAVTDLKDFAESLKPASSTESSDSDDEDDLPGESLRRQLEGQDGSLLDSAKSGFASILPMLDPPAHSSIFGFDVQRGCVLSRYQGARQIWVPRPSGGMIDVIHIPAKGSNATTRNSRAVLYCNPNAGLIEVATGLSLSGGNISSEVDGIENDKCWADFYTNLGLDIYLYNYAGFGRSYGASSFGSGKAGPSDNMSVSARIGRVLYATFLGFKPSPQTLRADGLAVGSHIVNELGVSQLVIHGESIGGVAASGTARHLSESALSRDKLSLLICDRTFCNLEATAQRLVGGWSGYAISMLAPFWSTDVVLDFVGAGCPKVVANDAADAIIFDSTSLKSGVAYWKEVHHGTNTTKRLGWMKDAPTHYRMAVDYENVGVAESKFAIGVTPKTAPVWPADKYVSEEEAFHFAACVKRIGKLASLEKRKVGIDPESGTANCQAPIFQMWKFLGTCEGLCGSPLGTVVRSGYDVTVAWLCATLTYGGQSIVESMEHRNHVSDAEPSQSVDDLGTVTPADFDRRPAGFQAQESDTMVHPKPIPEVVEAMKRIIAENPNDESMKSANHEVAFVIGTLEYVIARLSAPASVEAGWKLRHLQTFGPNTVGSFINLQCGHNNPFSSEERRRLKILVTQATSRM
eukprot:Nitzschia sp. Nitz4//scaffold76_size158648//79575//82649//NITZ4_002549-RA/size158648-augustus-gene-0.135-mRNA-1//1//CDS//3329557854//3360//frame0